MQKQIIRLLDTDTLSHLFAQHPKVVKKFNAVPGSEVVGTTIITRIETLRGRFDYALKADTAEDLMKAHHLLTQTEEWLKVFYIAPFTQFAADHFLQLNKRIRIRRADLLIACICLAQNAFLVTRNVKDFRIVPNLRIENWLD